MARVTVAGTTGWGTTLGVILAKQGHSVYLWARTVTEALALQKARENKRFAAGAIFPSTLRVCNDPDEALGETELLIVAVPSTTVRVNLRKLAIAIPSRSLIVSATKGIDLKTGKRMSELIYEETDGHDSDLIGALSGPNLAREIADGKPSSATVAFPNTTSAKQAQSILNSESFRVYRSDDLIGVELGGALKNIVAIGAGIIDGLGLGNNSKSAFLTRGLHEISRLGVTLGAKPETFYGLAGVGDMIATAFSQLSRNRHVGEQLAKGKSIENIVAEMDQAPEGIHTTNAALTIAQHHGIDMPLTEMTARVMFEHLDPLRAIQQLMRRAPAPEIRATPSNDSAS